MGKCTSNRVLFDELLPTKKYTEWQMGTFSKQYLFKLTERWCETCVKICPLSVFSFGFLWICSNSSLSVFYSDLPSLVEKCRILYLYQQTKRNLMFSKLNNGSTLYQIRVCMKQGVHKRFIAQNVLKQHKRDVSTHKISRCQQCSPIQGTILYYALLKKE